MFKNRLLVISLALLAGLVPMFVLEKPASGAGTLPPGFQQLPTVRGLSSPTAMEFAPDGRLFVAEQGGKLRVIKDGKLLPTPVLDLSSRVDSNGERGLLGVAFDPGFTSNGYFYVHYTAKGTSTKPPRNRVSRFTARGDGVVPSSQKLLLELDDLGALNHNGGAIHFGKDGYLYVAVGDNNYDEGRDAQRLTSLRGKVLRINRSGAIPPTNPFYSKTSGKNRAIWALGFRNPFSFAVQPGTGRIYVNDVGSNASRRPAPYEEINDLVRGTNYGWPTFEGPEDDPRFKPPVFAYRNADGGDVDTTGCAITGGVFYNPPASAMHEFPSSYVGDYFFADYCSAWIRRYDPALKKEESRVKGPSTTERPVDLKVSSDGDLYYLNIADKVPGEGTVEIVRYTAN